MNTMHVTDLRKKLSATVNGLKDGPVLITRENEAVAEFVPAGTMAELADLRQRCAALECITDEQEATMASVEIDSEIDQEVAHLLREDRAGS